MGWQVPCPDLRQRQGGCAGLETKRGKGALSAVISDVVQYVTVNRIDGYRTGTGCQ